MKTHKIKTEHLIILCASLAGLAIRFIFRNFISRDMNAFLLPWFRTLAGLDLHTALATQVGDYNLLYQDLIILMTRIPLDPVIQYKLLSTLFDFLMAFGVYAFVGRISGKRKASIGYAITVLLPTVWLNSAAWGQCDSMYTAMIVWSLYFLYSGRSYVSFVFLGLALSLKLQTVFILPFYGYLFLSGAAGKEKRLSIMGFLVMLAVPFAAAIPNFAVGRPVRDLIDVYLNQTETYSKMFMNYPSIWSTFRLQYGSDKLWCIGLTFMILCVLMLWFYKSRAEAWGKHFLWCAFILTYTCVLFLPSMHERYGYLYEILLLMLVLCAGKGWAAAGILQLITLKTYLYYLYNVQLNIGFLSAVNIAVYVFILYAFYRELCGRPLESGIFERDETEKIPDERCSCLKLSGYDKKAILILTAVFLTVGSMHLGSCKAPETSAMIGTETENGSEVYVSFDKVAEVDSLCIYQKMSANVNFRPYYAKDGKWEPCSDSDIQTGYVFSWKTVDIKAETHQLCIIFSSPEAEIAEIVCLDKNGDRIHIKEDSTVKELIDEQDSLTGIPTGFDSTVFDEIYHGRTGYEFLHRLSIYETSHPPLGKIIISAGISLFGMNPFGWRIMSLLFGAMCVPVMYLFALRVTGKSRYALTAGILQVTEFMHYALSRIATIDIFAAFFVICMMYGVFAFLQEKKLRYLIMSGAAFALGAATKWTALYAAPGVGIILLVWMIRHWKEKGRKNMLRFIAVCFGCFVLLPCTVYVLSYIPYARVYPDKGLIGHAVSNSISMYKYHSNVTAEHPFASPWHSWLFDLVPLVDLRFTVGEYKYVIATFVNPAVCYIGLASVLHHFYLSFKKDKTSMILLLFYLCMLVPWMFITRTVFIYQYFICTKILILMIVNSIRMLCFRNENRVLGLTAGLSAALFAAYLPVISGVMVRTKYVNEILRLLPKWWF